MKKLKLYECENCLNFNHENISRKGIFCSRNVREGILVEPDDKGQLTVNCPYKNSEGYFI